MCIDSSTSLASFIIGEVAGLLLVLSGNKEKKAIGLFIMFYSLVQLFEYNIYNNNNIILNSKLLSLNLALQGLVFFSLLKSVCNINNIYIYISLFVVICSIFVMLYTKNKNAYVDICIKWDFLNEYNSKLLTIMYLTMFHSFFFNDCIRNNNFLNKIGYFFLITYILSEIINKFSKNNKVPSYWCLSSAVLAPSLLLF
jgi:hypothetical protein